MRIVAGNPGRRPINDAEPKYGGDIGKPPAVLDRDGRSEWRRIVKEVGPSGVLTAADRGPLSAYCAAYSRWLKAEKALALMAKKDPVGAGLMVKTPNGCAIQNPLVGVANKAMELMTKTAAEFGFTPSSRSRIRAAPEAAPGNPFHGIGRRG